MTRAVWISLHVLMMVLAGGVGGAGVVLYQWYFPPQNQAPVKTQGEQLESLESFSKLRSPKKRATIAALGRLKPRGDVIDIAGLMGARLGSLEVNEGDHVKKGATLGYLDSYAEANAQWSAARVALEEARTRLAAEEAYSQALTKEAAIGVREAKELDLLDIKAQEARVSLLDSARTVNLRKLERLKNVESGTVSPQTLEDQELLVQRDERDLEAAKALLEKAKLGHDLKLQAAQAQLEAAEAGLKRVKASGQLESLAKSVDLARAHLDRTILTAPSDGYILNVLTRPGETAERLPILKMGDTSAMYAVAEVYETDILDVEVGQTATVYSRALDSELRGKVERIGQMVFKNDVLHIDPAADADARVVQVWILLDSPPKVVAERMTNLQVDVEIKLTVPHGTNREDESAPAGE